MNIQDAQIYVSTYAKYNNGFNTGAWLKLEDYSDSEEFYDACKELHSDEEDAGFMFQDWENIPSGLIGESWLSDNFFPLRDALDDKSEDEQEAFFEYMDYCSYDIDKIGVDEMIEKFEDAYIGMYDNEEEFAQQEATEMFNIPSEIEPYFNYESFARDLFCTDYYMSNGHVFRCC